MATVIFSELAEMDLDGIADYTQRVWGDAQADRYLETIMLHCWQLASHPLLGRAWITTNPGLRRLEVEKHVIFYSPADIGIRVERILHQSMLPGGQAFPT